MDKTRKYRILGLMSGTSLDGLDIACVDFRHERRWSFRVKKAVTIPYDKAWEKKLRNAHLLSGEELLKLHSAYGRFLGKASASFIEKNGIKKPDGIASHGHTIFHQPWNGFTFQLGDASAIHAITDLPVVSDFRSLDVQLGGEGAPLVPAGDRLLFASADICLNLGGIANLSMEVKGRREAFDICFCNMALNFLSRQKGDSFDRNGRTASKGSVDTVLLDRLTRAYATVRKERKSLGREFFEATIAKLLDKPAIPLANRLRTVCESVAEEINLALPRNSRNLQMLTTGGGALNQYLVEVIRNRLAGKVTLVLPPRRIIDFKEAVVFAFLGLLRLHNQTNVLSSVTQSKRDSTSGALVGKLP